MLAVMRNPRADETRRDDMAKAAAPYCHPRQGVIPPEVVPVPKPAENVIPYPKSQGGKGLDG